MSRFFEPISESELMAKINATFVDEGEDTGLDPYVLVEELEDDLKVKFDLENFESECASYWPICGVHTLENGLTYCGMSAGGDWEAPVFFIVYWDGTKLRAYVPTDGNPYNTATMTAYGNDEEGDEANCKKRYGVDEDGSACASPDTVEQDPTKIIQDILKRIKPK